MWSKQVSNLPFYFLLWFGVIVAFGALQGVSKEYFMKLTCIGFSFWCYYSVDKIRCMQHIKKNTFISTVFNLECHASSIFLVLKPPLSIIDALSKSIA